MDHASRVSRFDQNDLSPEHREYLDLTAPPISAATLARFEAEDEMWLAEMEAAREAFARLMEGRKAPAASV